MVQRSESEEDILPLEVVLAMGMGKGEKGRMGRRDRDSRQSSILKTTEVEVCGEGSDDEEGDEAEDEKGRVRRSQKGW